jgi:hypothetical protein
MSVVASRPWTAREDMFLRQLAAAGTFAARIAVEMNRSEPAIRKRAMRLKITLAKVRKDRSEDFVAT